MCLLVANIYFHSNFVFSKGLERKMQKEKKPYQRITDVSTNRRV